MPRRPKSKYQLPRTGRRSGPGLLFWLGLLVLLVIVIWFFWPGRGTKTPAPTALTVLQSPMPVTAVQPFAKPPTPLVSPVTVPAVLPPPIPVAPPKIRAFPPEVPPPAKPTLPTLIPLAPNVYPRPVANPLEAQVALVRLGISPGSIDGALGSQTKLALRLFQRASHLPPTGILDPPTRALLTLDTPVLTEYIVSASDLARLQPIGKTWLEKSRQSALDYETEVELVGEHSHANPALIRQLNPAVDWRNVTAGMNLTVPDVQYPDTSDKAALVVIHLSGKFLEAFDESSNLLLHCPCSIAANKEKRPVGLLHVVNVAPHPTYIFDPAIFPESTEAHQLGHKLKLPPGPNNPVGVAWMGLDRPGYGMHGTPAPEQVGRTESHGCFRLANWDAEYLVKLVWVGMPVQVVP